MPSSIILSQDTPGTTSWTVPDIHGGLPYIIQVRMKGAGGGGAGGYGDYFATSYGGASGSEGEYGEFELLVTPDEEYILTVGAGGLGGAAGGTVGGKGGTTSFDVIANVEGGFGGGLVNGVNNSRSMPGGGYVLPANRPLVADIFRIPGTPGNNGHVGLSTGSAGAAYTSSPSHGGGFWSATAGAAGYLGGGGAGGGVNTNGSLAGGAGGDGFITILAR
jgi:hypothetical protein